MLETIDIGGPAMLRAAAKSHPYVTPVCRPEDYDEVLEELRAGAGNVSPETGGAWPGSRSRDRPPTSRRSRVGSSAATSFPETFVPAFDRMLELSYGENPHQQAAYYAERGALRTCSALVEQLPRQAALVQQPQRPLRRAAALHELDPPACVIVKHANPCGVAVAETVEDAYARALAADPVSAYGGVVVVNRAVTEALGEALAEQFVEVLFAPGYHERALEALARKASIRILGHTEQRAPDDLERDYRRVLGGLLVQDRDSEVAGREGMEVVSGEVSEEQWDDLLFAWRVAKHVTRTRSSSRAAGRRSGSARVR